MILPGILEVEVTRLQMGLRNRRLVGLRAAVVASGTIGVGGGMRRTACKDVAMKGKVGRAHRKTADWLPTSRCRDADPRGFESLDRRHTISTLNTFLVPVAQDTLQQTLWVYIACLTLYHPLPTWANMPENGGAESALAQSSTQRYGLRSGCRR